MTRSLCALGMLLVALGTGAARAESKSVDGWGRITVFGGYRLVPNGFFADKAAEAGSPMLRPSPGGPQGGASFGYGTFSFVEICIDLLVGYETFELEGQQPYSSITYGGLLGARFTRMDLLFPGFAPYAGVQAGPILASVSSGSNPQPEKLQLGISVNGGFNYRFAERFAFNVDVRWMYARYYVEPIAGANVGGLWFSAGFTFFFTPAPKKDLDVPGF
ncbi:MAG: hypothetical protein AB1938_16220 [Myxococcota bacterium]